MPLAIPVPVLSVIGRPYEGTHAKDYNRARGTDNWESENAVDLATPVGTPVRAVDNGTIGSQIGSLNSTDPRMSGLRLHLVTATNEWYYAHLSVIAVHPGQQVAKGQVLGLSGIAGVAHLHLACADGDPLQLLLGAAAVPSTGSAPPSAPGSIPTGGGTGTLAPGDPVSRQHFADAVLIGAGAPVTKNNRILMVAWQLAEGTSARNNPYATTQQIRGTGNADSTGLPGNPDGVQEYKTTVQGIQSTVATLVNGRYATILVNLHRSADPHITAQAVVASPWGTHDLSSAIVDKVANNYAFYAGQSIGPNSVDDTNVKGGVTDVVPGADTAAAALSGVSDFLSLLTKGSTWIRVAEVVGALAVIIVVVVVALRRK